MEDIISPPSNTTNCYYLNTILEILVSDWLKADQCILTCVRRSKKLILSVAGNILRRAKKKTWIVVWKMCDCLFKQWCNSLGFKVEKLNRAAIVVSLTSSHANRFFFLFKSNKGEKNSFLPLEDVFLQDMRPKRRKLRRVLSNIYLVTNESKIKNENTACFFRSTFCTVKLHSWKLLP